MSGNVDSILKNVPQDLITLALQVLSSKSFLYFNSTFLTTKIKPFSSLYSFALKLHTVELNLDPHLCTFL